MLNDGLDFEESAFDKANFAAHHMQGAVCAASFVLTRRRAFVFLFRNMYGSISLGIVSIAPFRSNKAELTKQLPLYVIFYAYNRFLQSFGRISSVQLCQTALHILLFTLSCVLLY